MKLQHASQLVLALITGIVCGLLWTQNHQSLHGHVGELATPVGDVGKEIEQNHQSLHDHVGELATPVGGVGKEIEKGPGYRIFTPSSGHPELFHKPEIWIASLIDRLKWLGTMVVTPDPEPTATAREAYLEFLQNYVSGAVFGNAESSVVPEMNKEKFATKQFSRKRRSGGEDWAYLGDTMVGTKRLLNVKTLLEDVFKSKIPGDYIETGVWRGGCSIYARGVIRVHGENHRRSFVCDSFCGLPPGERNLDRMDKKWDRTPYLEVSTITVADNFRKAGLLDPQVIFVQGFFNVTMKALLPHIDTLAVMRLDGDMYESTVDVLYRFYERLSIGGYVIMDDWTGFPSQTAVRDFFSAHKQEMPIIKIIDTLSAYWQKTNNFKIQQARYQENNFKDSQAGR